MCPRSRRRTGYARWTGVKLFSWPRRDVDGSENKTEFIVANWTVRTAAISSRAFYWPVAPAYSMRVRCYFRGASGVDLVATKATTKKLVWWGGSPWSGSRGGVTRVHKVRTFRSKPELRPEITYKTFIVWNSTRCTFSSVSIRNVQYRTTSFWLVRSKSMKFCANQDYKDKIKNNGPKSSLWSIIF